jgi:hypothetical protein
LDSKISSEESVWPQFAKIITDSVSVWRNDYFKLKILLYVTMMILHDSSTLSKYKIGHIENEHFSFHFVEVENIFNQAEKQPEEFNPIVMNSE